jgi:hypothetical protein
MVASVTRALALGGLKPVEPVEVEAHEERSVFVTDYALNQMPYAAGMVVRSWLEDDIKRASYDAFFGTWCVHWKFAQEYKAVLRMVGQG